MKGTKGVIGLLGIVSILSGCTTWHMTNSLVVMENPSLAEKVREAGRDRIAIEATYRQEAKPGHANLVLAYRRIHGISDQGDSSEAYRIADLPKGLSGAMLDNPLVRKLVDAAYHNLIEGQTAQLEIDKSDVREFVSMVTSNYGPRARVKSINDLLPKAVIHYLLAYYCDSEKGFVNREGTVYKRPEIKTSIGNDVICATVEIALEGFFDSLLDTPVYKDDIRDSQHAEREPPRACHDYRPRHSGGAGSAMPGDR
jgi:hypothetical protein